jgi:uncharacterized integral membrane protein
MAVVGSRAVETEKKSNGRLGLLAVLGVVALVFILLNSQEVKIKFLVGETTAPLILALVISTALGAAVGYLMGRIHDHDRRRKD